MQTNEAPDFWVCVKIRIASFLQQATEATIGVLRNFVKLTPKHRCQSIFSNKVAE